MRGKTPKQPSMLALVSVESMVPAKHPLRGIKMLADEALRRLDPVFATMYAKTGRPSVPPERLLKSMLLMALHSVRSERQFCEKLRYNMLFRWFLDMDLTGDTFVPTVFSHNRERLLEQGAARRFFDEVVELARERDLLSEDHFSVDGTLIEAWGSKRSFRPKAQPEPYDANGFADFKGTKRSNETHESATDPDARLMRKGGGREAKLSHGAHALMENRNGIMVDVETTEANGKTERSAALTMVDRERKRRARRKRKAKKKQAAGSKKKQRKKPRMTLAADKAYDTKDFVRGCRDRGVVPHVTQNEYGNRRSAIDGRTTRHAGYAVSQTKRLLIEKLFGWLKTIGGHRRSRFRGRARTHQSLLMAGSALNLLRIANLSAVA
jgi:transposase